MQCISPLELKDEDGLRMEVRCGRCRGCRVRRKMAWLGRLCLERLDHKDARFLTLTYEDKYCPPVLQVDHLRDFLKRYRYHYGACRFFAVGEYGGTTGRPHWHLIVFGHPPEVVGAWKSNKAWNYGFSSDGNCTIASMRYCAGYVLKKENMIPGFEPVVRQSLKPGIGFRRIAVMGESAASEDLKGWPSKYYINEKPYPLCDGGLAKFQTSYLEAGGKPLAAYSRIALDMSVHLRVLEGTRFEESKRSYLVWERERDGFSAKEISKL